MDEFEILEQIFSRRMDLIREVEGKAQAASRRPSFRERLRDPQVGETVQKAREIMRGIPDVREGLVASLRKQMMKGSIPLDGKTLADRILQEAVLDELW